VKATGSAPAKPESETAEALLARILTKRRENWPGRGKYQEPAEPDTTNLPKLPNTWTWATVARLGQTTTGFTPPKQDASLFGGDIPFFKPSDLDVGYNVRDFRDSLTEAGAKHGRVLPPLSILVTCIGATIGKTGLARVRCTTNQQINALTLPTDLVSPHFVFWYFNSSFGQRQITDNASATTLPILNKSRFEALPIPLAPLGEQLRIVAEIEKQFTRLDAAVAALRRVQANLKRYRFSVLKAACEGCLVPTEAELAKTGKRKYPFETGEALLARILTDRLKNWDGRGGYNEPAAPHLADLPSLPDGWTWARLEQLGLTFGGLTKNPKRQKLPRQLPYLRVANVYANELRLQEIEYIGVEESELKKLLVHAGDLLIVEGNGSKDQIGRLAIWDGSIDPCVHQNHLIKVRAVEARMQKWLLHWLQSPTGRHYVELVASSTSGLYTLSVSKVGDLAIALPPLAEQKRIVAEVERRLSVVDELEAVISANLKRAARLRLSILHKAFTGELTA
jgi:type I restriction enzyme S subunit